jgi:hypothetical protein
MHPFSGDFAEYYNIGLFQNILFRGLKYAIDFTNLPHLPYSYYLNFEQMSFLEFALEVCDVANHDLFVDLVPILDHPYTSSLYSYNLQKIADNNPQDMYAAMIVLRSIDKTRPPRLGAIQSYLQSLPQDMLVYDKDLGYELTNDVLDRFIVGASETELYMFPSNHRYEFCPPDQLVSNLAIIPYYGTINGAVTIPKGVGSYSQIVLEANNLFADGVGDTYVATEMELRAASISYEKWVEFLLQYNNLYMESVEQGDIRDRQALRTAINEADGDAVELSETFAVTVPRCLFPPAIGDNTLVEGEPKNPCHPPYGWPLYWHRATNIGIPQAGVAHISLRASNAINSVNAVAFDGGAGVNNPEEEAFVQNIARGSASIIGQSNRIGRAGLKNAQAIYAWLKK